MGLTLGGYDVSDKGVSDSDLKSEEIGQRDL